MKNLTANERLIVRKILHVVDKNLRWVAGMEEYQERRDTYTLALEKEEKAALTRALRKL
jgi:hypothetical protein